MEDPDWNSVTLKPFNKNFLTPIPQPTPEKEQEAEGSGNGSATVKLVGLRDNSEFSLDPLQGPVLSFHDARLPRCLRDFLSGTGFDAPTTIQANAWALGLSGYDIIAIAQTGSGKTLAYLAPALTHILLSQAPAADKPQAPSQYVPGEPCTPIGLVVVPTHELVQQIQSVAQQWEKRYGVVTVALHGGVSRSVHTKLLLERNGPIHLIAGTPGRLLDLVSTKALNLSRVTYFVLDEADKLLKLGFANQLKKISNQIRPDRHTLMFSATFSPKLREEALNWVKSDPIYLQVGKVTISEFSGLSEISSNIEQIVQVCAQHKKEKKLIKFLTKLREEEKAQRKKSGVLIFVNQIKTAVAISDSLWKLDFRVDALYGNKPQNLRQKVVNDFKCGKIQIVVATDVASRGLDIPHLPYVINYDFPSNLDIYVHRVGRTGRQGKGVALSYLTRNFKPLVPDLIKLLEEHQQTVSPLLREILDDKAGTQNEAESPQNEEIELKEGQSGE
uniref:RNA helicase n=1 Tax=Arcella intermedia TaxID=1963864 RepID=A0A6B2L219_9EUKA